MPRSDSRCVRHLPAVAVVALIAGCGPSFSTYEAYQKAPGDVRTAAFRKALTAAGVASPDRDALRYLPLVLEEQRSVRLLEKALGTDDFSTVFSRGVPVLYHAYSPETFKAARETDLVKRYVVSTWKYQFDVGEDQFRKYLGDLVDKGDNAVFAWVPGKGKEADEFWKQRDLDFQTKVINTFAWRDGPFDFELFKKLPIRQQAQLLRQNFWVNMVSGDKLNDDSAKVLNAMEEEWVMRGDRYVRRPPMSNLETRSPFTLVSNTAVEAMLASVNR